MNFLVKTISTEIRNLRRFIKFYKTGKSNVQTAQEAGPYGEDSNPIKDMVAVFADTSTKGKKTIIGYINKNQLADVGEKRIYSTDADGELQAFIWLKNDGTIEMNGADDNLVRFLNTKAVIDEIQSDIATLKTVLSSGWVTVPNDGGAALKVAAASWAGTALAESIDDSKVDTMKTP